MDNKTQSAGQASAQPLAGGSLCVEREIAFIGEGMKFMADKELKDRRRVLQYLWSWAHDTVPCVQSSTENK